MKLPAPTSATTSTWSRSAIKPLPHHKTFQLVLPTTRFRLRRVSTFLKEPWNLFDLSIVVAVFLPLAGPGLVYLRLARIFRIMRLIRIIPTLPQAHVATIWSARQAFVYIAFLMSVLFSIYAVAGVFLFREAGSLHFLAGAANFFEIHAQKPNAFANK